MFVVFAQIELPMKMKRIELSFMSKFAIHRETVIHVCLVSHAFIVLNFQVQRHDDTFYMVTTTKYAKIPRKWHFMLVCVCGFWLAQNYLHI